MSREEARRGRRKADYTCAISKRVCPFNDDFWEDGLASNVANDNCPIEAYENGNYTKEDGTHVIDDWCRYLIPRD